MAGTRPVNTLTPADPAFPLDTIRSAGQGSGDFTVGPNGDPNRLIGYSPAPTAGWTVLAQSASADAFGPVRGTLAIQLLAMAEHGLVQVHLEPVLVQRLLPPVLADVQRKFPGITINVEVPGTLPAANADSGALRQVLTNLLSNAAKYAEGSPIVVAAARDGLELRVDVADEGPGLEAGEYERLFEPFYRSPANARRASGTGIGLFVVRELVVAMGGRVAGAPNEPRGSRFTIHLPLFESAEMDLAGDGLAGTEPAYAATG